MTEQRLGRAALLLAIGLLVLPALPAQAAGTSVYASGLFQLGDGQPPSGFAGTAQIASRPDQPGPAWLDLFNDEGWPRDDYPLDADGEPLGNGVPDFRDRFGGLFVAFTADNEDAASGFEPSALGSTDDQVINGSVTGSQDLVDLLGYAVLDGAGDPVLYLAVTRATPGSTSLTLELNQGFVKVGRGGYGAGLPWSLDGDRTAGDLRIRLDFDGSSLVAASAAAWDGRAWQPIDSIPGEGCNAAESFCALINAQDVAAGPWPGHSATSLPAGTLVQVGLSAVDLLALRPDFVTLQARTSQDVAFAYFSMEGR